MCQWRPKVDPQWPKSDESEFWASKLLDLLLLSATRDNGPCQDGIVIISNKSVSPYSWWCLEACSTADFPSIANYDFE